MSDAAPQSAATTSTSWCPTLRDLLEHRVHVEPWSTACSPRATATTPVRRPTTSTRLDCLFHW